MIPGLKEMSYEQRLKSLKLPSLYYRRARGDMIEVYKYTHGLYTANEDLLAHESESSTRGHQHKLKKRYCRTATRQNFFSYRVVDSWNLLPDNVVNAPSLNSFKSRLDRVWANHMYTTDLKLPLPPTKVVLDPKSFDSEDRLKGSIA